MSEYGFGDFFNEYIMRRRPRNAFANPEMSADEYLAAMREQEMQQQMMQQAMQEQAMREQAMRQRMGRDYVQGYEDDYVDPYKRRRMMTQGAMQYGQ